MEEIRKALKVRPVVGAEASAAVSALRYVERFAVRNESVETMINGGDLYVVTDDERPVCFFSLACRAHIAWVGAAVGRLPGVDLVATVLPVIEKIAIEKDCELIGMVTRRKGMAAKLRAMGYRQNEEGFVRWLQ